MATQQFYIISINHFCWSPNTGYIPAELGLIKYSIENGVEEKLHAFIYQNTLPLGTAFEAKNLSESTHMLPQPPDALGDPQFSYINAILKFLGNGKKLPPVFTDTKEIAMVENILSNWEELKGREIMVCSTGELLFRLKEKSRKFDLE